MAASDDIGQVIHALENRVAVLESELRALRRDRLGDCRVLVGDTDEEARSPVANRRGVLRLAAATAVGAAAASVFPATRAAAVDGDPLVVGSDTNSATAATHLKASQTALVLDSTTDYGLVCAGGRGNAMFVGSGLPNLVVSGPGDAGALRVDGHGNWWAATATSPTDAGWRIMAGPDTAGSLHLLDVPKRIYDSRLTDSVDANGDPMMPLVANVARTIELFYRPVNSPIGPVEPGSYTGTPPWAHGALITLTVTNPTGAGWVSVWPGGAWPGTSTLNFAARQTVATTTTVALQRSEPRSGATFQAMSNATTDVVIDYIGYYL